jgi:hypothetical protein
MQPDASAKPGQGKYDTDVCTSRLHVLLHAVRIWLSADVLLNMICAAVPMLVEYSITTTANT